MNATLTLCSKCDFKYARANRPETCQADMLAHLTLIVCKCSCILHGGNESGYSHVMNKCDKGEKKHWDALKQDSLLAII